MNGIARTIGRLAPVALAALVLVASTVAAEARPRQYNISECMDDHGSPWAFQDPITGYYIVGCEFADGSGWVVAYEGE